MKKSIIKTLNNPDIKLSKSDEKILSYINGDYERITKMSIQTLAKQSKVSEPTINRLVKKMGCTGFPDFKMRIVQEISQLYQVEKVELSAEESSQITRDKILDAISQSIHSIKYSTSIDEIEKAVELFAHAKRISFFGLGASGSVALDAQHKFLRLGIPVLTQSDFINQQMLSATMGKDDLLCLISYSGTTKQTLEIAQISRQRKIPCISITRSNSKLAGLCDVVINAETSVQEDELAPMSSRIIHLVIIDILTTLLVNKKAIVSGEIIQAIQEKIKGNKV